jgi:hypothetical protein
MERRGEFAAANLQAESYLEREHNVRWAALGVAHATSGITANVLTLLLPRNQFNPYLQAARGKEVEQWQSGADHNVIANSLTFSYTLASFRAEHTLGENSGRRCSCTPSKLVVSLD